MDLSAMMKTVSPLLVAIILALACVAPSRAGAKTHSQPGPSVLIKQANPSQAANPAEKKQEDCGCEAKAPPDVLAIVDGVNIPVKDVDEPIKVRIAELQGQVTEARKRQLDIEINSRLLESEAGRLGLTSGELLEREIVRKVNEPTDADAQAFYNQNKNRIQGEFNELKDQIVSYLRGQREQEESKKFADRLRTKAQVKVLFETPTPPATDGDRARVFATVNGKRITSGDVEDSLKALIFSVQEQVYSLRKQSLDRKINDSLLDREAKKRNLTADALFDAEVSPRVKRVTTEDAHKFYEENKDRIDGSFNQVQAQILQYLQNRERSNAEGAYADQLRKGASVQVFLKQPDPPMFDIAIDDRPWRGGANAPVTIVEFTDYECPSCGTTQPVLEEVVKEFGDKVKLVARNFPLDQHKHAFKAAEAAEAAREQGKYWEYVALLFKNQKALEVEKLKDYATQLGLDRKKFDPALDSGKFADKVKRDLADGNRIGVDSTPTVFINGKRVREKSRDALKLAIEAALKDGAKK